VPRDLPLKQECSPWCGFLFFARAIGPSRWPNNKRHRCCADANSTDQAERSTCWAFRHGWKFMFGGRGQFHRVLRYQKSIPMDDDQPICCSLVRYRADRGHVYEVALPQSIIGSVSFQARNLRSLANAPAKLGKRDGPSMTTFLTAEFLVLRPIGCAFIEHESELVVFTSDGWSVRLPCWLSQGR